MGVAPRRRTTAASPGYFARHGRPVHPREVLQRACMCGRFPSGALEPILQDWWRPFTGPFLYYPSRRYMPAPLRALVDFISRNEFA